MLAILLGRMGYGTTWWHYLAFSIGYWGGIGLFFYLIFLFMRWLTRHCVNLYRRFR